jgi:hypothetical protein
MSASNLELVRHILTETALLSNILIKKLKSKLLKMKCFVELLLEALKLLGKRQKKLTKNLKPHIFILNGRKWLAHEIS